MPVKSKWRVEVNWGCILIREGTEELRCTMTGHGINFKEGERISKGLECDMLQCEWIGDLGGVTGLWSVVLWY